MFIKIIGILSLIDINIMRII